MVLSLGINHRENLFESVTGSLQALHRKTVEKYRQATIYVPINNFSRNLAVPHQTLLTGLNAFITIKYNTLSKYTILNFTQLMTTYIGQQTLHHAHFNIVCVKKSFLDANGCC